MSQTLNPLRFPLHGSQLIEASAGTGKTWTIAALYLRLVLGHGGESAFPGGPLRPDQILVMTFTRAATRELSDRIRQRLLEAAEAFRQPIEQACKDPFLQALRAEYSEESERERAAWRLATAAESMDDAAIHTIDAWCQRMLREHAFDSGQLFDEELVADEQPLWELAVRDYWRQEIYPLRDEALDHVLSTWPSLDKLLADARDLAGRELSSARGEGRLNDVLQPLLEQQRQELSVLRSVCGERAEELKSWLTDQWEHNRANWDGRRFRLGDSSSGFLGWVNELTAWSRGDSSAHHPQLTDAAVKRLTHEGILDCWKGKGAPPPFPEALNFLEGLWPKLAALASHTGAIRCHAAVRIAQRMEELKQQRGQFGFQDLQRRLVAALEGSRGSSLKARMLAQTPIALIDEFQDTSGLQYRLFDRLYDVASNHAETALLLIGDPKQSIYRFRGADIQSYLRARQATEGRHHVLGMNFRSAKPLVEVVNALFDRAEERPPGDLPQNPSGAFLYRVERPPRPVENPVPFEPVKAQGRPEVWSQGGQALPALELVYLEKVESSEGQAQLLATQCAEQIVQWLNDPTVGFHVPGSETGTDSKKSHGFKRLQPADVAVLVRNGREAQIIREALAQRGIATVYLSDRESVMASQEASDLLVCLRAVSQPQDSRLVRAALATSILGLPLSELARLASDDEAFDRYSGRLRELLKIWQRQGVLTMLRQLLHRFQLPVRWLNEPLGERRLTNVLHLSELLQTQGQHLEGEPALIRWLAESIDQAQAGPGMPGDELVVRLESDADLVKVVTVHKSKGLEYPLVCLPFATSMRAVDKRNTRSVWREDPEKPDAPPSLKLDPSAEDLAWADQERLREDLRLLYVALTRARHALWMGFGAFKVGNSSLVQTHRSAAGHLLLGGEGRSAQEIRTCLEALCKQLPATRLRVLTDAETENCAVTMLAPRGTPEPLGAAPAYEAKFDQSWTISSFSSLVKDLGRTGNALSGDVHEASLLPEDLQAPASGLAPSAQWRPADDEQPVGLVRDAQSATALVGAVLSSSPVAMVSTEGVPGGVPVQPVWHRFERGALAGNFLHDQLEWLAGEHFDLARQAEREIQLRRRVEQQGRAKQADDLICWLKAVVATPLRDVGLGLAELSQGGPLIAEMEFWLPAERLPVDELDVLCRQHIFPELARPQLTSRALHGMLMGFADLVFMHEGRYWVLDYKSNHLGDNGAAYAGDTLRQAMMDHRYDVQAAIYLVALHRLLRARLGERYEPQAHLGGAIYFFLRGLDGPTHGMVNLAPPPLGLLTQMDHWLEGQVLMAEGHAEVPEQ